MTVTDLSLGRPDGTLPLLVVTPGGPANGAAIVQSPEGYGINEFGRGVATDLAALGYTVVTADYYRGGGPSDPENYDDFTEVMGCIEALDFVRASHDVMAAVEYARTLPGVDPARIGVWGYCTGGTLALLTACLDRRLAAAVVHFPSQPTFAEHDAQHPVDAMDLLWNVACPLQLLYGDQDPFVDAIAEIDRRLTQWEVTHELRRYDDAGHAFTTPRGPLAQPDATRAAWADATEFVARHLSG
jgi:carboxymethylenebutenolidase